MATKKTPAPSALPADWGTRHIMRIRNRLLVIQMLAEEVGVSTETVASAMLADEQHQTRELLGTTDESRCDLTIREALFRISDALDGADEEGSTLSVANALRRVESTLLDTASR